MNKQSLISMYKVALAQLNATVGDIEGNTEKIVGYIVRARARGAARVVFPELAITGYPPEDLLLKPSLISATYKELHRIYNSIRQDIISRLREFRDIWEEGSEEDLFKELVFCLLTPQSKAERCWEAVNNLEKKNLLFNGDIDEIANELNNIRFKYNKARYILEARKRFIANGSLKIKDGIKNFEDIFEARDWLVKNVKGMGYKEASHFLRNIGLGENFAILDRHILKNLKIFGMIEEIPENMSKKMYFEIEQKIREFSKRISIPLVHLDFVLWYKETKHLFK